MWPAAVLEGGWAARVLAALHALRLAGLGCDATLAAACGLQLPAHRALLAAAAPRLLQDQPGPLIRIDAPAAAVRELLDFIYTGRLRAASGAAARGLYVAAARMRVEAARSALAARLLRALTPADCLAVRALPGLGGGQRALVDAYIAEHFDEVLSAGGLGGVRALRVELLRESSAHDGEESPSMLAAAALAWTRAALEQSHHDLEGLCARGHMLYVDAGGALRDCGELGGGAGEGAALREYRQAAARRAPPAPPSPPAAPPAPAGDDWAVLAARRAPPRATRALLALGGEVVAVHITWRAEGGGGVARGAPLPPAGAGAGPGEARAALARPRCALGGATLGGKLLVLGGYDRAQALRSVEVYDPASNTWAAGPELSVARARCPAARLGGAVYALGGSDGLAELDSVDVLAEGGRRWEAAPRMPGARSHAAAAAHEAGGALYCVGGWAAGVPLRAVCRLRGGRWEPAPALRTGRSQLAAAAWRGALWALGGCDAWHCLASTELLPLDRDDAEWIEGPALPTARRSVGGAVCWGALVSAGGSDGACSLRRTDWLPPPPAAAAAWLPGPPLREPRAAPALLALDEVLYAVGGFSGQHFLSSVECLYELAGEWTALRDARPPRHLPAPPPANKLQELTLGEEKTETNGRKEIETETNGEAEGDDGAAPAQV
ncbi:hypothetical protein JYU34_015545 [Plutella xylostella]|uniref:BTB domain-containing protein n=1 Tax=Plutella xylostella TaxID=51655 RepID=A0ABQ7Q8C1_PLUXY|nr:hypothetical protein JYU34_015545 [Plutella xylostella]